MPLQRPNGNRNKALQGVLSRHVEMGARMCPMLACHCPQLGVLWDGFGVEQTQRSRAPVLKAIPFPWDLCTVPTKGSSDCPELPCADCSPIAVSRRELSSPGQDMAVFPEPLWEIRAGSATRCPPRPGGAAGPRSCLENGLIPRVAGSILWRMHPPGGAGSHGCKEGSWKGSRVRT